MEKFESLTNEQLLEVRGGNGDLEQLKKDAEEMLEELRKSPTSPRPSKGGSELEDAIQ